jgi:hypothetical protein
MVKSLFEKLLRFDEFCRMNRLSYQIHAGFASYLYQCYDQVQDIDIRIFTSDLELVRQKMEKSLNINIKFRGPLYFEDRAYLNNAIVWDGDTRFDICSEIITARDGWVYRLPFNENEFNSKKIDFNGIMLPVVSMNFLLLYYLTLRRNRHAFDDYFAVKAILSHSMFEMQSFVFNLESLYYKENILEFLERFKSS